MTGNLSSLVDRMISIEISSVYISPPQGGCPIRLHASLLHEKYLFKSRQHTGSKKFSGEKSGKFTEAKQVLVKVPKTVQIY